ncbi:hypothetical protein [Bifidobacterium crudilactis]|uniref:hypothetical protein n=1 Tax=Bifidobacterium crudilactis TaxID=327277 RepID=UPI00264A2FFA|nr:hypothetical protein [Bifidobacterium crudilactis]MDN5973518.1 hypothetical protein [Bifidobacterium crudilactis]MDN6001719.1 hypothetical protein [Bifidobacterium crudilactis]MDN6210313.1 hypothetical protein [Bifidobacterium crudilactis]MDN6468297.1 hypothetical protein [Bifidobacterium crudilactis]MDN6773408.1 hypothetical protein [Bifidobacterium crudilactis]
MKGNTNSMMKPPTKKAENVRGIFREDPDTEQSNDAQVLMAVNVKRSTKQELKLYAAAHDRKQKEIVEAAILEYIQTHN